MSESLTLERQVDFDFSFPLCTMEKLYQLKVPIEVPFTKYVPELVQRLCISLKLPPYVEEDLERALKLFVDNECMDLLDDQADYVIDRYRSEEEKDSEDVIKYWEKRFKESTGEYIDNSGANDSEVFSAVFHKLVHSPALEVILQQELTFAVAVAEIIAERDKQVNQLTEKQTEEMCTAVDGMDVTCTEADINELAGRHLEQQSLVRAQWDSQVDAIREGQRRHYRQWLMDKQALATTIMSSPQSATADRTFTNLVADTHVPTMQESFTIHLGSQMKQMHNIRLLCADVLDFCQLRRNSEIQPQRLQTALALYSNDLCGLVLLSDTQLGSFSTAGISREFINVCQSSTEFHFSQIDDQLEHVKEVVREGITWRKNHVTRDSSHQFLNLTSSEQQSRRSGTKHLQTGDVYLTHHSNLAEVHVIFHMAVDDSLRSSEINSRHPTILGLRNILKTACSCDITTLTIPVLLTLEMTEEMTVAWCNKRAELVFKCVKGFMIEMASWGGSDLKNLQFLVPKGISEDVFASLAVMLPSIFRVSNPLVFKLAPSTQTNNSTQNKSDKSNKNSK